MHINWIGKSSELKLQCFCLIDAYSMPKDICSVTNNDVLASFCEIIDIDVRINSTGQLTSISCQAEN